MANAKMNTVGAVTNDSQSLGGSAPAISFALQRSIPISAVNVNKNRFARKHPRPYGRGAFLWAYMRQHLPKKPHSSFSREAQSKLQNIMLYLLCVFPLQGQRYCNRFVTLLQM